MKRHGYIMNRFITPTIIKEIAQILKNCHYQINDY